MDCRRLTQATHEPAQAGNLVLVARAEALEGFRVLPAHAQGMGCARPARAVHAKPVALHDGATEEHPCTASKAFAVL